MGRNRRNNAIASDPRKLKTYLLILVLLIAALELVISRYHFLDDAFIHLRIAQNLAERGYYSFNGYAPQFASSSPLYTSILALFALFTSDPYLPKLVNLLAYIAVLIAMSWTLLRTSNWTKAVFLTAFLFVIASPFSIRWSTDGMETGFVVLMAMALAQIFYRASTQAPQSPLQASASALLCLLAVLLRVEFLFVLAIGTAAICARYLSKGLMQGDWIGGLREGVTRSVPIIIGALLGTALILLLFGHLLPDTAVAKQAPINWSATVMNVIRAHVAASMFGIGMLVLWVLSAVVAYRHSQQDGRVYLLVINGSMPLFMILLACSGQIIQGIRYFVFVEIFVVVSNILIMPSSRESLRATRLLPLVLLAVVAWITFDTFLFYRIAEGRSQTYLTFLASDYDYLQDKTGAAWDVGMVGFFTRANIQDMNGLVNGREMASLDKEHRVAKILSQPVDFIFANEGQLSIANEYIDTSNWTTVGEFDFTNTSGNRDTHFLIVRPGLDGNDTK